MCVHVVWMIVFVDVTPLLVLYFFQHQAQLWPFSLMLVMCSRVFALRQHYMIKMCLLFRAVWCTEILADPV